MTVAQTSPYATSRSWGEIIPPKTWVRMTVVAMLLGAVYWATIWNHLVKRWMNDGNWSHGWLVPVFSVYLLATQRERLAAVVPRANYLGVVVLVCSLGMYFVASWWWPMVYPQIVSIVGSILGLTLLLGVW